MSGEPSIHQNCFTLTRTAAALAVIFEHSYDLQGAAPPVAGLIGNLAVHVFFTISGFLIAGSLYRGATLAYFVRARLLRIYPGLIACVVVIALSASVLSTASWSDYLAGAVEFVLKMGSLLEFKNSLPGVFETNPYPRAVNGSLWTLPMEMKCYIIAAGVSGLGLLKVRRRIAFLSAMLWVIGAYVLWPDWFESFNLGLWRLRDLSPFLFSFLLGMLFAALGSRALASDRLFVAALLLGLLGWWLGPGGPRTLLLASSVGLGGLALAFVPSRRLIEISMAAPDYSYGTYIYAFPIQQTLLHLSPNFPPLTLFVVATVLVVPMAALSWSLVEKRALQLKGRNTGRHDIRTMQEAPSQSL